MVRGTRARVWVPMVAILVAASDGACQNVNGDLHQVQRAVSSGAQGSLAPALVHPVQVAHAMPEARGPEGAPPAQPVRASTTEAVPVGRVTGTGSTAVLTVTPDADHVDIATTRLGTGWGIVWTDPGASVAYLGRLDAQGQPVGASTVVRRAVPEEESVASPAVAAEGDGVGVAWVDTENGRVRFRRFDGAGHPRGRASIVHEGLEAPRVARIVWNGREFGVAVAQWQGVYFARIAGDGERIGDGVLVDEGTTVGGLDAIEWDGTGYTISWSQHRDGSQTHLRQRLGAGGQREGGAAVMGVINRPRSLRDSRRVM